MVSIAARKPEADGEERPCCYLSHETAIADPRTWVFSPVSGEDLQTIPLLPLMVNEPSSGTFRDPSARNNRPFGAAPPRPSSFRRRTAPPLQQTDAGPL